MNSAGSNPFVPAGSRFSHHANMKSTRATCSEKRDREQRTSSTDKRSSASCKSGPLPSGKLTMDRSHLHDQIQRFTSEIAQMAEKTSRVQKDVDEASVNIRMLRELVARLDTLGGKDSDKAELHCNLIRTQLEGLEQSCKTMPHYYPSYPMFGDMLTTLKKILTSHDYVNQVTSERTEILRENERLRDEVHLLKEETERLKRRHNKDKKTIGELERRSTPRAPMVETPVKLFSPQTFHSANQREEDLKLIEMLRDLKAALQDGDENSPKKEYEDILARVKEATKPEQSDSPRKPKAVDSMDSYFKLLESNISLIDRELKSA